MSARRRDNSDGVKAREIHEACTQFRLQRDLSPPPGPASSSEPTGRVPIGGGPEETLRIKLASCRQNIELTDPGVEWLEASSTLSVHWLLGPSTRAQAEGMTLRIGVR